MGVGVEKEVGVLLARNTGCCLTEVCYLGGDWCWAKEALGVIEESL